MIKINDLTLDELIKVAESGELTPEQEKKVKEYALTRLQFERQENKTSPEQRAILDDKISRYRADIYGVADMGYPYVKASKEERKSSMPSNHVDMYCGSEPLQ